MDAAIHKYNNAMYDAIVKEIDDHIGDGKTDDQYVYFAIMKKLFDDSVSMPSKQQALSVGTPITRFVLNEMLTQWSEEYARGFRQRVSNHLVNKHGKTIAQNHRHHLSPVIS